MGGGVVDGGFGGDDVDFFLGSGEGGEWYLEDDHTLKPISVWLWVGR